MKDDFKIPNACRTSVSAGLLLGLLFAVFCSEAWSQPRTWRLTFPENASIRAAGEYSPAGETGINLESFSPLCLEPSTTATWSVARRQTQPLAPQGTQGHVIFRDSQPGLRRNPSPPPFYTRAEGTISAVGWVPGEFENVKVTGEFNTAGTVATSRQGLIARWDQGNNHYWLYVNFSSGTFGIVRSRFFGVLMDDLPGSSGRIQDFQNTKTYYLEFELRGNTVQGKVFDRDAAGNLRLVGDTGAVRDPEPQRRGVSGILIELWQESPFTPLEGSFGNLTSMAIQ